MCHPAVYVALAGYNILQARQTMKAEEALAEQAYHDRQEQIKDNRLSVQLELTQKGNSLSQVFLEQQATNRALLSPSGIGQSNSLEAALGYSKGQYMREMNVQAIEATKRRGELAYASRESALMKISDKVKARSRFQQSLMQSVEMGIKAGAGLGGSGGSTTQISSGDIMGGASGGAYGPLGSTLK